MSVSWRVVQMARFTRPSYATFGTDAQKYYDVTRFAISPINVLCTVYDAILV